MPAPHFSPAISYNTCMIEIPFHVRYDELDARAHIPAATFLKYFQQAAAQDSAQLGFGWEDLIQDRLAWIVTHMQARALQADIPLQDVTVKTWHVFSDRLLSRRQFVVYGHNKTPLFEGSSWWAIMDVQKRRLTRTPQRLLDGHETLPPDLEPEENFKAPLPAPAPAFVREILTREEDLDLNGHINNTHYAAWAIQSVPLQAREGKKLDRLLISFKNECRADEKMTVGVYPCEPGAFWLTLTRQSDGKEAARVYTRWA